MPHQVARTEGAWQLRKAEEARWAGGVHPYGSCPLPFALRLRQLTQIVSSSTPTGRMRDVWSESVSGSGRGHEGGKGNKGNGCQWPTGFVSQLGAYKSCTFNHNRIEAKRVCPFDSAPGSVGRSGGPLLWAISVGSLLLLAVSLLLTFYGLLHKQRKSN